MIDFDHCVLHLSPRKIMGSYWPDLSRYKNNGRIYGAQLRHGAMYFNGINNEIELPRIAFPSGTIVCWVYFEDGQPSGNYGGIIKHLNGCPEKNNLYLKKDTTVLWQIRVGGEIYNHFFETPYGQRNAWHMYGIAHGETEIKFAWDGKIIDTHTSEGLLDGGSQNTYIGWGSYYYSYYHLLGYIGEFFLFDKILSEEEFEILYQLTSPYGTR